MKNLVATILLLLSVSVFSQAQDYINFEKLSYKDVLRKSRELQKPVFVDFYADWCLPCKMMDKEIFTDPQLARYINHNFVSVKVDADHPVGKRIADNYEVYSLPTLLMVDERGNVLKNSDRVLGPEALLKMAQKAKKKYDKKR